MPAILLSPEDIGDTVSSDKIAGRFFVAEPDEGDDGKLLVIGEAKAGFQDQPTRDKVRAMVQVGTLLAEVESDTGKDTGKDVGKDFSKDFSKDAGKDVWLVAIETADELLTYRIQGKTDAIMLAIDLAAAVYGQGTNLFVDMKLQAKPKQRYLDEVLDNHEVIGREKPEDDTKKIAKPSKRKGVSAFVPPDRRD